MEKIKQCNKSWGLIKHNTTRDKGLNTRSLTYLLKTVVLTKLLYAGVIWLHPNLEAFNSLWNKFILKCSGAIVFPHRELMEIVLQLPPLEVQLEIISIKFLCKCLSSNDNMTNIVHQIDGSLQQQLYFQLNSLKDFLTWKLGKRRRREIELTDEQVIHATHYTEAEMKIYMKKTWLSKTYNKCIGKQRTSIHDASICESINNNKVDISKVSYLFSLGKSRYMDSRVMDFVHGSSDRFLSFTSSAHNDPNKICRYCESEFDSPIHQLLYCTSLDDSNRRLLVDILQQPHSIIQDVIFTGNPYLYNILYNRVKFINSVESII